MARRPRSPNQSSAPHPAPLNPEAAPIPAALEFRAWLEQERAWGRQATELISRQRRQLAEQTSGMDRFAARMALVDLTGSVAAWASGLNEGLLKWDQGSAAAPFAVSPPFAATDLSAAEYTHLEDFVRTRVDLLGELLTSTP